MVSVIVYIFSFEELPISTISLPLL
jgi:hypothetical protein